MSLDNKEICCPKFDPKPWNEVKHEWHDKPFIKETIPQIFHIPLPVMFGKKITKMWNTINNAGAATDMKDFLMLSYDPSPWKSELYMSVAKEVSGACNVKISGKFYSKVFDGPYNAVPKWIKEMDKFLSSQNLVATKYYFYFTTCPKCAKKYGHNYVVAFAQV